MFFAVHEQKGPGGKGKRKSVGTPKPRGKKAKKEESEEESEEEEDGELEHHFVLEKETIMCHLIRAFVEEDEDFDTEESDDEGSGKGGKKTGSAKKSRVSVRN